MDAFTLLMRDETITRQHESPAGRHLPASALDFLRTTSLPDFRTRLHTLGGDTLDLDRRRPELQHPRGLTYQDSTPLHSLPGGIGDSRMPGAG